MQPQPTKTSKTRRWLGPALAVMLLAGCVPRPAPRPAAVGSPAASLLAAARQALACNDLPRAEADLERALRLEADNGLLWHTLAETKYREGDNRQAVQLALRANTLLPTGDPLARENDRLLAQAYHKLGQEEQARQAAARAGAP